MAQPDFAYRPSSMTPNDPWMPSRRWEQSLDATTGEEYMSADLRQARSTMIPTRPACMTRPPAPTGHTGKSASQTRPSYWHSENNLRIREA